MGVLPVTPELAQQLNQACADIELIRGALIAAAGLNENSSRRSPEGEGG